MTAPSCTQEIHNSRDGPKIIIKTINYFDYQRLNESLLHIAYRRRKTVQFVTCLFYEKKTERKKRTDLFSIAIGARSQVQSCAFHISLQCSNLGITSVKITEILPNSEKNRRKFDENGDSRESVSALT